MVLKSALPVRSAWHTIKSMRGPLGLLANDVHPSMAAESLMDRLAARCNPSGGDGRRTPATARRQDSVCRLVLGGSRQARHPSSIKCTAESSGPQTRTARLRACLRARDAGTRHRRLPLGPAAWRTPASLPVVVKSAPRAGPSAPMSGGPSASVFRLCLAPGGARILCVHAQSAVACGVTGHARGRPLPDGLCKCVEMQTAPKSFIGGW